MKTPSFFILSILVCFCSFSGAVETTIKGGRMALIDKGNEVVFSGGVRLERGTDIVEANEMHTDKSRQKVTALGNVRLFRKTSSTETWRGTGEKGFYNTQTGSGYLTGKVKRAHLIRTEVLSSTTTRTMELWAERIDFADEPQSTHAQGNVEGKTTDPATKDVYEFFSNKAEYDGIKRKLKLSGTPPPRVFQKGEKNDKKVTGRIITYDVDADRMESEGNAEAIIKDYPEERGTP